MATQSKQVQLNIEEMKDFLRHMVSNNAFLQESGKVPVSVEIEGEAGIGKTSAALQLAAETGLNCVKINLAQIEELGDLVGYPVRQFQLCKEVSEDVKIPVYGNKEIRKQVMVGGKLEMKVFTEKIITGYESSSTGLDKSCMWIDEQAIADYQKQGYKFTGEKRMSYCPPEWIAGKSNGGFLIIDDYSRADQRFLQATMELIDRQSYISWSLPKGWNILLTSNPDNGDYQVNTLDVAQKTRFISVGLKFDVNCWAMWAEKESLDTRCINFLLMHPEVVNQRVNPRSITTFFNSISSIKDFDKDLPLIQMVGEGSVGGEVSTLFTMFINNKLDKMITPKDILFHADDNHVFNQLEKVIGKGDNYRADIASVLASRVANYGLVYAEKNSIPAQTIDRIIKLVTTDKNFTDDLKYVMVRKFLNGNKLKFQKLTNNAQIVLMGAR